MLERLNPDAAAAFVTQLQARPVTASTTPALTGPLMQSTALVVADSILPAVVTPRVLTKADVLREFDRYAAWVNTGAVNLRDTKVEAQYRSILAKRDVAAVTTPEPVGTPEMVAQILAVLAKHPLGARATLDNAATSIADAYNAIATVETTHDAAVVLPSRGWFGKMFVGNDVKSDEKVIADAYGSARTSYGSKITTASYAIATFEQVVNTYLMGTQLLPSVVLRTQMAARTVLIQNVQQRINELTAIKAQLEQEGQYAIGYATQGNAQPAQRLITGRAGFLVRFEAIDLQLGAIMDDLAKNAGAESLANVMPEFGPLQNTERLSNPADLKGAHGWCVEGAAICDRSMKALGELLNELNASQARDTADSQRFSTVERQVVRATALADL